MAVSTNTYFSNSIPGTMLAGCDIDIYEVNVNPKWALGTGFTRQDGNIYRYSNFVTACTQGKLVAQTYADTSNTSTDALVTAPSSTYQMPNEIKGIYPGAVGSRYIIYTLAAITRNQFAGGYFTATKDTGVGYIYRIKGNTATGDPGTGLIRIELFDPIIVAMDATTDTAITGSPYNDLVAADATTNLIVMGTTVANMPANSFGWICTHGVCVCLQSDVGVSGDVITLSPTVAGAYCSIGIGTTIDAGVLCAQALLGYCIDAAGNAAYSTIYLQLE